MNAKCKIICMTTSNGGWCGGRRARQCQGRCSGQLTSGDARGPLCQLRAAVESRTRSEAHALRTAPRCRQERAAPRATLAPGLFSRSQVPEVARGASARKNVAEE
ncbi:hypothetical protein KGM_202819 [Danaus plexippus plexippus]|uniref:Uncharacterized protein n=1 Tax=Danaus plexippus plexippus TaxID=278856 RepID=A0A212ETA4_DANPL|nr:hypothetical protein KGM_202819 [Danaus plexippus plexippus]